VNIFYLSEEPREAAQMMVDKHVVKMILESAQLLSTAHRVIDGAPVEVTIKHPDTGKLRKKKVWVLGDSRNDIIYNATHINHPSAIWCRQSVENYNWLVDHFYGLMDEYTYRYGKVHKSSEIAYYIQSPPYNLRDWDMTKMPCAMDKEYIISDDSVTNYRNYYKIGKQRLHTWTKRNPPDWIE
jgi:hypothetical protein